MQRRQEAELRQKLLKQQEEEAERAKWSAKGAGDAPLVTVMHESTFEAPLGRRSFASFNPVVERLCEEENASAAQGRARGEGDGGKTHAHLELLEEMSTVDAAAVAERLSGRKRLDPETAGAEAAANFYKRSRRSKRGSDVHQSKAKPKRKDRRRSHA